MLCEKNTADLTTLSDVVIIEIVNFTLWGFKMKKEIVINENGDTIPVEIWEETDDEGEIFVVAIDGVEWVVTENRVHATVLFNMICDHITEYMHYEKN